MMTRQQYNHLYEIYKRTVKRKNLKNKENKKKYIDAKKEGKHNKKVADSLKASWKRNKHISGALKIQEVALVVKKLEKKYKGKVPNDTAKEFIKALKLVPYFDKQKYSGGSYILNMEGEQALEEYRLERKSKIILPWIAIAISVLAFGASVAALFTG